MIRESVCRSVNLFLGQRQEVLHTANFQTNSIEGKVHYVQSSNYFVINYRIYTKARNLVSFIGKKLNLDSENL